MRGKGPVEVVEGKGLNEFRCGVARARGRVFGERGREKW